MSEKMPLLRTLRMEIPPSKGFPPCLLKLRRRFFERLKEYAKGLLCIVAAARRAKGGPGKITWESPGPLV